MNNMNKPLQAGDLKAGSLPAKGLLDLDSWYPCLYGAEWKLRVTESPHKAPG